jgi:uncharacterized protein YndB with AHSA1/START domain
MSDDGCPNLEVSRRIEASAAEIFRVLADPRMHVAIGGSEMLRGAETNNTITGVGDVFIMNMYFPAMGDYQMDNHIVEFEPNTRIGWQPVAGAGHPERGATVGHRWSFRLSPDGPEATIVTEVYDCSRAPRDFREQMNNGAMWSQSMVETLERLDGIVSRR